MRPPIPTESGHPVDGVKWGTLSAVCAGQGPPFAIRKGRSDARREIADAEGSRSSAPEVRLWGERAGDRPIGWDRPHGDREYIRRAAVIGITWPIPEELDDTALERKLFAPAGYNPPRSKPLPEWGHIHAELRRRGVTLALLWEEYRRHHPDGYGYSWFCDLYVE